jgi:dipeptidyl aminopeptidase/acylaminoacyl peptidase
MNSTSRNNPFSKAREIPLRDFFKNPEKISFKISKDGEYISYLAPYKNRLNIFVQKIGEEQPIRITEQTERDIISYFWSSNERILYLKDNKGDENYHLIAVSKDGSNPKDLTPFENITTRIIDELEEIDSEILIGLNKQNQEIFDVYRLNTDTGEMIMIAENPGNISGWYTDHDGKIRAAMTTDGVNTSLLYRETEGESFRTVLTTNYKETVNPLFFTFNNKYVYASSNLGRDKSAIVIFDIAQGKELEMIFEHPEVDVYDMRYSKKRKVPTYIGFTTWKRELKFLDEEWEKTYNRISSELGNYEIVISDNNKNEDRFLIRTYSDRSLGSYYFYDKTNDRLVKLADISPWLKEDELCEMKPIEYSSRDGLRIHGYLTLPQSEKKEYLPTVVVVHGGPWARDNWSYDPEAQFLSNRGYAVLQVNFRGSVGYGRKFWEASFKQWGKTMQNDISDGVRWAIEKGVADPKRIAIYGGSYGGYATLAGLTFTPELYACGVDYVGVSNLFTFMKTIPPYWKPFLEMMYDMVGDPEKDKELLKESSPVFHVNKIKAPLLIAQGRMDPRVNVNESDQMVEALKKRGIDVPYMVKDNEGHGFRNEENRFEFYEAMEQFLKKHLDGSVV